MKKITTFFVLFGMLFISVSSFCAETTSCECGEHSTKITAYTVEGVDADCCRAPIAPGSVGFEYTYSLQTNGVWQLTGTTQISGATAQDNCCRPT